jgi:hypothetical protein
MPGIENLPVIKPASQSLFLLSYPCCVIIIEYTLVVVCIKYFYYDDQSKEYEMDGHVVRTHGRDEKNIKHFSWKPQGRRSCRRSRRRFHYIIYDQ